MTNIVPLITALVLIVFVLSCLGFVAWDVWEHERIFGGVAAERARLRALRRFYQS